MATTTKSRKPTKGAKPAKRAKGRTAKARKTSRPKPAARPASKSQASPARRATPPRTAATFHKERLHCIATDPFGDPCQTSPRYGSKYCSVHSHLDANR